MKKEFVKDGFYIVLDNEGNAEGINYYINGEKIDLPEIISSSYNPIFNTLTVEFDSGIKIEEPDKVLQEDDSDTEEILSALHDENMSLISFLEELVEFEKKNKKIDEFIENINEDNVDDIMNFFLNFLSDNHTTFLELDTMEQFFDELLKLDIEEDYEEI